MLYDHVAACCEVRQIFLQILQLALEKQLSQLQKYALGGMVAQLHLKPNGPLPAASEIPENSNPSAGWILYAYNSSFQFQLKQQILTLDVVSGDYKFQVTEKLNDPQSILRLADDLMNSVNRIILILKDENLGLPDEVTSPHTRVV